MTILGTENVVTNIITAAACMIGCQSNGDLRTPVNFVKNLDYFTQVLTNQKILCNPETITEIKININIIKPTDTENTKCNALVNNANGSRYRCTRNRKFGQFCGLHHNRKNTFKY